MEEFKQLTDLMNVVNVTCVFIWVYLLGKLVTFIVKLANKIKGDKWL